MTIMLASAFSAFAPSAMPEAAAANANLYVSAESSQFQNYFAGPQVIEVVVIDSDIKDTDKGKGEPDLTINGKRLRMVQATDGNWYGYFADKGQALKADAIAAAAGTQGSHLGNGTDFGTFCASTTNFVAGSSTFFSDTSGVAFPMNATSVATAGQTENFNISGDISGGTITASCDRPVAGSLRMNGTALNVIREQKSVNLGTGSTVLVGQIGLNASSTSTTTTRVSTVIDSIWPFIQLYQFSAGGNVVIQYNKGGGVQKTTLVFDTIPSNLIGLSTDRSNYPLNSQVHTTMTDPQLNIDPTDEDSWTFGTLSTNPTINYQLFDENGVAKGDGFVSRTALSGNLTTLMFEKNGVLKLDADAQTSGNRVVLIQDNDDSVITGSGDATTAATSTVTAGNQPVTFTEQGPNNGVYGTYDELDTSVLKTTSTALRGTSASVSYNDKSYSIVIVDSTGTLNFDEGALGGEWNSGEEVAVTLVDGDQNLNGRADEDLDVFVTNATIPAIKIGSPLTLAGTTAGGVSIGQPSPSSAGGITATVDAFSDRLKIIVSSSSQATTSRININVTTAITQTQLRDFLVNGSSTNGGTGNGIFNYFQYDLRSINVALNNTATLVNINIGNASAPNQLRLNATTSSDFSTSKFQNLIDMGKIHQTTQSGVAQANMSLARLGTGTGSVIIGFSIATTSADRHLDQGTYPITADFLRYGITNDGSAASDRSNNAIYRLELEETGDNTATFAGTVEYIMLNQINVNQTSTYKSISTADDQVVMIVGEDLTDEDSVRANFNDLASDGSVTQIADQVEAPTHSGVVSFDASNYKLAAYWSSIRAPKMIGPQASCRSRGLTFVADICIW
jgi:hypothetical protein